MNKWFFRIATVIIFLDAWVLSVAGLIYITKAVGIEIHPLLLLAFEITSLFSLFYYEKYLSDYCETTRKPTTEEVIR